MLLRPLLALIALFFSVGFFWRGLGLLPLIVITPLFLFLFFVFFLYFLPMRVFSSFFCILFPKVLFFFFCCPKAFIFFYLKIFLLSLSCFFGYPKVLLKRILTYFSSWKSSKTLQHFYRRIPKKSIFGRSLNSCQ